MARRRWWKERGLWDIGTVTFPLELHGFFGRDRGLRYDVYAPYDRLQEKVLLKHPDTGQIDGWRVTKDLWGRVEWQRLDGEDHWPDARPKPSWSELTRLVGVEYMRLEQWWLRTEARQRIARAYGEAEVEDEILLRLRGGSTADQDAEAERLRGVYRALRARMGKMTSDALGAFDCSDDAHWSPVTGD